jgi:hypothetical protein
LEIAEKLPDAKGADEGGCPQGRKPVAAGTTVDESSEAYSPNSSAFYELLI